jgi:uncharacterized membrane protein YfcA
MTLTLKQKALLHTVAMFIGAILGSFVLAFIIANVSAATIANAIGLAAFVFLGYAFYGITLSRLEYREKLKEMKESFDKKD